MYWIMMVKKLELPLNKGLNRHVPCTATSEGEAVTLVTLK